MKSNSRIVKLAIRELMENLTRSERQLAATLLQDYPVAGLQSITRLALAAKVSTPTVIRMARKLGFDGFPSLQEALREEASAQIKRPLSKLDALQANASAEHVINRFAEAVLSNLQHTLDWLDTAMFDEVSKILADTSRNVYIAGGRITRSGADYLYNHMQIIRPNVSHLIHSENVWPQYLLDMSKTSILVLFDIRRYEGNLFKLAKLAKERGCTIILFTDQWGSPIGKRADYCFNALVEVPSSWDSTIAIMLVVELLIADIQAARGEKGRERIEELESMFGTTKLFRNFN